MKSGPPATLDLTGPWEVSFSPGMGAPDKAVFDDLTDWTKHPHPGIRHYSGKAIYRKSIAIDDKASRVILDLGDVRDLAAVTVNGREFTTLWLPPWRVDIADAIKAGDNSLEIEIINSWNNRLAGDAHLPADQRHTSIAFPSVNTHTKPAPAGLLGTVRAFVENK